ncbi:MAG: T9SS type A sorting domain-containing protein [Bacteroidales bacterium]
MSINSLPELSEPTVVDIGFVCAEEGPADFEVAELGEFEEGTIIYLEDVVSGTMTELSENFVYSFSHSTGNPENRFKLHFAVLTDISESYSNSIKAWSHKGTIYVSPGSIQNGIINVFDIQGRDVFTRNYSSESTTSFRTNLKKGIYIVEVSAENEIIRKKVFLK